MSKPERKRLAGGVISGVVNMSYTDDWQREGILDAPAAVTWFYELLPGSEAASGQTSFMRWVKVHGQWRYVPFLDTMLDAHFTGLMMEAQRVADESATRRYMKLFPEKANAYFSRENI